MPLYKETARSRGAFRVFTYIAVVGCVIGLIAYFSVGAPVAVQVDARHELMAQPTHPLVKLIEQQASFDAISQALRNHHRSGGSWCIHNNSVLTAAVRAQRLDVVQFLLDLGANPNGCDADASGSPLYAAVVNDHAEIARLLLAHGADPSMKFKSGLGALFKQSIQDIGQSSDSKEIVALFGEKQAGD